MYMDHFSLVAYFLHCSLFFNSCQEEEPGWYSRASDSVSEPVLDVQMNVSMLLFSQFWLCNYHFPWSVISLFCRVTLPSQGHVTLFHSFFSTLNKFVST